ETENALDRVIIGTSGASGSPATVGLENRLPRSANRIAKALAENRCNNAPGPNALLDLIVQARTTEDPVLSELGRLLRPIVLPSGALSFRVWNFDFGRQGPIGDCWVISPIQAALQNSHIGIQGVSDMMVPMYDPKAKYKIKFRVTFPGYPRSPVEVR